jgi:hypothetical protein
MANKNGKLLEDFIFGELKMRFILFLTGILLLASGLACNNAAPPEIKKAQTQPTASAPKADEHNHADDDKIARISLEEAKKEFDAGNAVFVDTRDVSSHRFARIKGAIHLPAEAASMRWKEIPTGKKIIAYCS